MRKSFRKGLSLLLALAMILTMMPVSTFASSKDQIMSGYYVVSSDGSYVKDTTGATSVTQDGYTLTKTIDWTNEVNKFDITLKVETAKTVVTNDAAIAIVIDNSSSMEDCANGCGKDRCSHMNRLEAIQDILTRDGGFLDSLKQADSGKIYVSVIKFDEDAHKVTEWLDINEGENLQTVKNAVNAIKLGSGTNIHGGLMLGRNRLAMDVLNNVASKNLVLLSDGAPYRYANESSSVEKIDGHQWGGNYESGAKAVATQIRNAGTTVYSVGYGTNGSVNDLLRNIAGSDARAFAGNDLAGINAAFANIASSAVSGMNGAGTYVTDPMGQYINFAGFKGEAVSGASVSNNGTITWALDPETAETRVDGDTTYYTYTLKYTITLDTSAEGFREFEEDGETPKYYPANGYTYLTTPDGQIPFLVPGVKGTIPEYNWSVEYYLEDESSINKDAADKTYTLDKTEEMDLIDLWSIVNAPEGYEAEYDSKGYHFVKGDPLQLIITADSSRNVIRLYYNLDVANVTVEHYYKTTTITPAGETIVGEYPAEADKSSTEFAIVGKTFEASEEPLFGDAVYDFDKADPGKSIRISEENENLIRLYYSREDDQRVKTAAQVDHVYETYTYQTNAEGRYEEVMSSVKEEKVQYSEDVRATTLYNVSADPVEGREDFEIDTTQGDYEALVMEGGKLGFILKENAEDNIRTLYFKKIDDNREQFKVTVNHYYTKNITTIDEDGNVQNTKNPDNALGSTETYDVYKGDSLSIEEIKNYNGEGGYQSAEGNAAKLEIDQVTGNMTIDLYYVKSEAPDQASAFASHYWRTYTDVTVEVTETVSEEVVNEETGEVSVETKEVVTGTRVETRETIDHKIEGIEYEGLYEGQKHTEMPKNWGEGYIFNEEDSDREAIAGSSDHATLYYDKDAKADERREANVIVIHNYVTKLETIVDGKIAVVTQNDGSVEEDAVSGRAGDKFEAVPEITFEGNDYTRLTDDEDLSIVLQPGTNVIVINYEREASDLVEVDYNVDYEYRTYTMTINEDGQAGYWDEPEVITDEANGNGYAGQKITLDPKAKEGFELTSGADTVQYLAAEGNTWTFVYEKYIPLDQGAVIVNHHYKTITIAKNGTSSEATQDVLGTAIEKYIGENYTAEAALNGFTLTGVEIDSAAAEMAEAVEVTVGKNTVIDFYYEKTDDFSVPVTYSIAHEYYTYDWDGTPIAESKPEPVTGTGFAGNPLVAAPEYNDYTLTSVTYNGGELDKSLDSHSVILQEGENKIVFVYEKTLARDLVDVTVIHNYYKDEAALAEGVTEGMAVENFENQPEGSVFTAEIKDGNGYTFHSADPAEMSITVSDEGENVIVINYIRDDAAYEVIHVYNRNGVEEGRTSQMHSGLHGEVIDSDSIARVETYSGNTYTFVSATADITLDSEAEVLPVIILTYNRTVSNPPYNPPYNPPVNPPVDPPVIEIPEEDVPLDEIPEIEIPEEDVPLTEIPDEEVPLSGVPVTGDTTLIWMAISAASGAGLLGLGRRRKDDE